MAEIVDFGLQQHKIKMDSRYFENVLSVVAGDTGRRIEVQLLDTNGTVQNTTGLNLRLNAEIAGKATFTDATLVDDATGKYQLDLSNGMFLAPGNWQFQWQITDSAGKKLHSFAFTGNIGKNISEGGSQATNFYLNLEDLKKMQDDLINGTIDSSILETNIAEKLTDLETQYAPKLTEVTAQLAQKANETDVRKTSVPIGLNDADAEMIAAIEGGEGTSFSLLSIPRPKSVSPGTTTFMKQSSNLFNIKDVVLGKIIGADGTITDNAGYGYSHLINVTPGSQIYTIGVYHVVYYDADMVFKQRVSTTLGGGSLTNPSGCFFGRVTFNPNSGSYLNKTIQVNYGSVASPLEQYYIELDGIRLSGKDLSVQSIQSDSLKNNSVLSHKLKDVKSSTNLFDKSRETKKSSIDSGGNVVASVNNNLSDFIEVIPNSTISTRAFSIIYYFDREKKYLGSYTKSVTYNDDKWDVPANTYIIRGRYPSNITQSEQAQINAGNILLPYESYYQEFNNVTFSKKIKDDYLYEINDPNKRIMLDMPINGVYRTQTNMLTKWNYWAGTTSAEVYAKYDELMAQYPDYITKEFLGNDDYGNPISLYKFSQGRPTSVGNKRIPTIYLTAGVHGAEIISPFGAWLMFNEICNNWQSDPLLEALRFNVTFLIIPLANPTGFEDLTRWNRNRVDINRNFDVDWVLNDPSSGSYSGPQPMSEPETKAIDSVYDMYSNIDIMYDLHNFGQDGNNMLWVRTEGGPLSWYLGENLITLMTREWRKTYDFIPSNFNSYVGWVNEGGQATVGNYAKSKGVPLPGTLEVANKIYLDPDATGIDENLMKTTVEAYVNWILILLKELASNNKTIL